MDQNISESFGNVPHDSESFGTVPKASEEFRKLPNVSESLGNTQSTVIKSETHSMTVREAARAFEDAEAARTERSIINWCQPNRQWVSRLDCYFEENDHKYYIEAPAAEPFRTSGQRSSDRAHVPGGAFGTKPNRSEHPPYTEHRATRAGRA